MKIEYVKSGNIIDISAIRAGSARKLAPGLISPATEEVPCELAPEHAAEPIKSMEDIEKVSEYLTENGRFRDNMLFIVGINFGLRVSDLRMLRFSNIINENSTFKDSFAVFEKKTRNTRKRKKNRYITINTAVVEAVTLFLEKEQERRTAAGEAPVCLSDYMFRSESNRGKADNLPLSIKSIDRILKGIGNDLGLNMKISTHTLRKTFCYHQMVMSHNDPRKLLLLQKMLNHSSPAQTLSYIGITEEEIDAAYKKLNLGSKDHNYLVDSSIVEMDALVI